MESLAPENGWFSEIDKNLALSLRQNGEMLFHEKSDFQDVKIFDSHEYGRVLTLDDCVMLTEGSKIYRCRRNRCCTDFRLWRLK